MEATKAESCLLELEFILKPGKRTEFTRYRQEFQASQGQGQIRNSLYEDVECLGQMFWISEWSSRADAEKYLGGERFRLLLGAIQVLGSLSDCRLVRGNVEDPVTTVNAARRRR